MTRYVTSDLHLGHAGILRHTNRPESDVADMTAAIIAAWTYAGITKRDDVWVVGDFALSNNADDLRRWFDALPGRKHLVVGNHDSKRCVALPWESVHDLTSWKHDGTRYVLCHYPLLTWDNAHRGTRHLHGHCHGQLDPAFGIGAGRLDVGVDVIGYAPQPMEWVHHAMANDVYKPVDHHTPRQIATQSDTTQSDQPETTDSGTPTPNDHPPRETHPQ